MYYLFNKNIHLRYFGNYLCVDVDENTIELNKLQELIILCINKNLEHKEIEKSIIKNFNIPIDSTTLNAIDSVIQIFIDYEIIYRSKKQSHNSIHIYGKRNFYYPSNITLELTKKCNLFCKHCYKEANADGVTSNLQTIKTYLDEFAGISEHLVLTGGEIFTVCNIEEFINWAKNNFSLSILSNGTIYSNIRKISFENIKFIQLTMYGLDDKDYYKFCGVTNGYTNLCKSIKHIQKFNTNLQIAVTLTTYNYLDIESYIKFCIENRITNIKFGLSMELGRGNSTIVLNLEQIQKSHSIIEKYKLVYSEINITNFDSFLTNDLICKESFNCPAGQSTIFVNENYSIRPCSLTPEKYFNLCSIEEYVNILKEGKKLDFNKCYNDFVKNTKNKVIIKCKGFCKEIGG